MPSLGYLIDDPAAIAARTDPRNYDMADLIAAPIAAPSELDHDLGEVLDQDGVGACTIFAASSVRSWQEHALDEHTWEFNTASAFDAWSWLKNGHAPWPGDGLNGDGSIPLYVWQMAKMVGIPGKDGIGRKIESYWQLQGDPGSPAWIETQIQVLNQFGPVTVATAWPHNWWTCPSNGILPPPGGIIGAHMYVRKGYTMNGPVGPTSEGKSPTGRYWKHRQSWGQYGRTDGFGRSGEFWFPFEADTASEYAHAIRIGEIWKTIDILGDDPTPSPGGDMVPAKDKLARLIAAPINTQVYALETGAPLVKLSTAAKLYSPFAYSTTQWAVILVTGGTQQLVRVNKTGTTVVSTVALT